MSTFHIHFTFAENSGEIRRIKNINIDLAQKLSQPVYEIAFISIQKFINYRQYKQHKFKLHDNVIKKYYFPTLPFSYGNWFVKRLNSIWCSFLVFILWLVYKPKFAIAEFSVGWQALRFLPKSVTCIIDAHGVTKEEYEYAVPNYDYKISETYDYLEEQGMRKAKFVTCQSEAMKKYLLNKYSFLSENNIYSYKCGADKNIFYIDETERNKTRNTLGIKSDELLFIYSGGLHKWQKIEDSIKLFVEYCNKEKAKFLILTLDKIGAEKLISKYDNDTQKKFLIMSATNKEVYKYLNAADVAFLLRDDVILNRVASPTKLAEYMFCGLPVISTNVSNWWIDDTTAIFNVDKQNIFELRTFLKTVDKKRIAEYAIENLSLECDRENINKLLNKID